MVRALLGQKSIPASTHYSAGASHRRVRRDYSPGVREANEVAKPGAQIGKAVTVTMTNALRILRLGRVPLPVGRAGFKPVGGRAGVFGRFDSCLFRTSLI